MHIYALSASEGIMLVKVGCSSSGAVSELEPPVRPTPSGLCSVRDQPASTPSTTAYMLTELLYALSSRNGFARFTLHTASHDFAWRVKHTKARQTPVE